MRRQGLYVSAVLVALVIRRFVRLCRITSKGGLPSGF
jgi:hypothetical protein